jgi:integrase
MSNKTTWQRTKVQYLLKNTDSGRFYGRWTVSGKQIWRSLDTDVFTVAKLRLNDEGAKIERRRGSITAVEAGTGTVADFIAIYKERSNAHSELKASSKTARMVALKKLRKTWPELETMKPAQVTSAAVGQWVNRFKTEGTNFTPPGAHTPLRGNSAGSVNHAIDTLRRVMDIALERGAIHTNPVSVKPAEGRLKKKILKKKLVLPSVADVNRLFGAMENNGARGGWGLEAADFCRFLARSGCRIGETPTVTWACVDWEKKQVKVHGFKSETSDRVVPLFAELEALLKKIIERRKKAAVYALDGKAFIEPTDPVFRIGECQKTIDAACKATGVTRITHHDFRHLFATVCIESGVDIPTVSRWLGHADGGALAMKTYGHLRMEHSLRQAARVDFGGNSQ